MNSHGRRLRRLCEASGGRLASLAYPPPQLATLALITVKITPKKSRKIFPKKIVVEKENLQQKEI